MAYVLKLCCPIRRSVCHARRLNDYAYSLPCGKIISGQRQCIVIPPYYFSNTRAVHKIFDSRSACLCLEEAGGAVLAFLIFIRLGAFKIPQMSFPLFKDTVSPKKTFRIEEWIAECG